MSVEDRDSSVANMDVDDSKISYKRLLLDGNKLHFSVNTLKQNPFRVAAVFLGILCVLLLAGLIGQSVSYNKKEQENENKLQNVNAEKDGLQKSMKRLQTDKVNLEDSQRRLQQSNERISKRKDQIQTAYNSLAIETNQLKSSESLLKSNNAALTKELQQLNTTVVQLQTNYDVLSTAKDLIQVEFNQAVKLKTTLQANYATLSKERNILQNSFNNVTRSKDQLQLSYNTLVMQVENLEKRLHITNIEKDTMESSHLDAKAAKDALQDMYNIVLKATEQLNSSYNDLLREKQELERSCGTIRTERDTLLEKNGNLTSERDQLQLEVTKLNATITAKKCRSGWQPYMLNCYYTSSTKRNWKNSRDFCRTKGADLVIITTQEEMAFVNSLYSSNTQVWIGLTDEGVEGQWKWVDGTRLNSSATFWGSGQPNSYDGRNQDCVEFKHRASGHGEWNDESCRVEQYWICEM